MKLTPKEQEWPTAFTVTEVTRRCKERGVPLNHLEAVAYITDWYIGRGRDGQSVAEVRPGVSQLLSRENVMDGAPEMIDMIQVEPMFPDDTELVTVHDPVRSDSIGTVDSTADAVTDGGNTNDIDTSGGDDV